MKRLLFLIMILLISISAVSAADNFTDANVLSDDVNVAVGDDVSNVASEQGQNARRNWPESGAKTVFPNASCGLHQAGSREGGGSPWNRVKHLKQMACKVCSKQ